MDRLVVGLIDSLMFAPCSILSGVDDWSVGWWNWLSDVRPLFTNAELKFGPLDGGWLTMNTIRFLSNDVAFKTRLLFYSWYACACEICRLASVTFPIISSAEVTINALELGKGCHHFFVASAGRSGIRGRATLLLLLPRWGSDSTL